jgi:hypothetical protein
MSDHASVASNEPSPTPQRKPSPYVGPRAFRKDEEFYGRELEAKALINKLMPGGVTLLHSPSGAGKTSLIQASVVPWFDDDGFQICATFQPRFSALRVNLPPEDLDVSNRYVFSLVNGLVGHLVDRRDAARMTVEDALTLFAKGQDRRQLVVIDQLEEALTLDPNDIDGQREFFKQLGVALRRGRRWALLAMREDYMGGLDRFRQFFPNELRSTFRLDFLDEQAALRAIRLPAEQRGVIFSEAAARELVSDLRRVRAVQVVPAASRSRSAPDGATASSGSAQSRAPSSGPTDESRVSLAPTQTLVRKPGTTQSGSTTAEGTLVYPYVESVLLQVVCNNLWRILSRKRIADFSRIEPGDLDEVRPYSTTLSKYYRSAVGKAAKGDPDAERAIRDWVERQLMTKQTMRRPTHTLPQVDNAVEVVKALQRRYLVRDDPRPGNVTYWELSHDMLIDPIVEDNRNWRLSKLQPWQIVADEWHRSDRNPGFLLTGPAFLEAQDGASRIDLSPVEAEFLERSRKLADDETRRARMEAQVRYASYQLRAVSYQLSTVRSLLWGSLAANLILLFLLWRST